MKNTLFKYALGAFIICGCFYGSVFADIHPVEAVLSDGYGQVLSKDLESGFEFTVSADFDEIQNILMASANKGWYANFISISSRDDGKAAIIFRATQQQSNVIEKFATLQKILQPGMLIWKTADAPNNMAVVSNIETSFDNVIKINGITKQSGLIFSHLIPMIERSAVLQHPFFSRGTYSDTADGRIMHFTIDCGW